MKNIIILQIIVPEEQQRKNVYHEILCRFRNFVFHFQGSCQKSKFPAEMYAYPSLRAWRVSIQTLVTG